MSHTIRHKSKLVARVRRLKGQMEAIERSLEAEAGCADILNQVASVRGAISGLTAELMEEHIREHLVEAPESARQQGAEDLIDIIRTYLK
ncbi:metal/formaldehyde-sensitive transcriptional repressor [Roseibium marinum]|uniref:DNA-binding FrmR family transcriptional regulator n=1 Tax=Roseibium marinum TaxID=281252 RepID=A0A2S3UTY2_9HYPH|nr:metal/formaldehyde-sensitive transcriptional repressor [Roseibium marinum]POF30929.1 DNA-binding FrmR family transcriptional regulator [Roseibium marinum]